MVFRAKTLYPESVLDVKFQVRTFFERAALPVNAADPLIDHTPFVKDCGPGTWTPACTSAWPGGPGGAFDTCTVHCQAPF